MVFLLFYLQFLKYIIIYNLFNKKDFHLILIRNLFYKNNNCINYYYFFYQYFAIIIFIFINFC